MINHKFLTLDDIPPATFKYRLANRSASEWVFDQYQVSTDLSGDITNDPVRTNDPESIVRPRGQDITVSMATVKMVKALRVLGLLDQSLSVANSPANQLHV